MKTQEMVKIKGSVKVELFGPDGKLKKSHINKNLVVTVGKTALAAWLAAATQSAPFMPYVGLGTGVGAAAAGDTALGTEFSGGGYARILGTVTSAGAVLQNVATFPAGNGTGAVTEAGLFSALTSGTLMARQVFSVYNKAASDSLQITWTLTFS
jgi:roadblock/LC7 domain-containing protein